MRYAIFCYHDEKVTSLWTRETGYSVITKLALVEDKLKRRGKFVAAATLGPADAATTLRMDCDPPILACEPHAQAKDQLLSFYIVDCDSLEEAHRLGRDLGHAYLGGAYEMRPSAHLESTDPGASNRALAS